MKAHIIILNYNGAELLARCLPSIIEAARSAKTPTCITVLDNESRDASRQVAGRFLSHVTWHDAPQNKVLCSYNEFLARIDEEVAILLNNDIVVSKDFVDPLVEPFRNSQDVFMVTSKCLSSDGSRFEGGRTRFRLKYGIFWAHSRYPGHEALIDTPGYTLAAGYGAVSRKKFLELGGYDELYLPGRQEDTDICFRAWRRGWKCLYEPKSVIYHSGGETFNREFGESLTLTINERNSFLFLWKNLEDPFLIAQHIGFLPLRLAHALVCGKKHFVDGFFRALGKFKQALARRQSEKNTPRIRSDREIFNLV
ncbi:MAG: glycosyltransferase [Candidatus Omnitrophica bacterium]|nr:glycosyltransferase [Candidatus Omnitrophota bacterium]